MKLTTAKIQEYILQNRKHECYNETVKVASKLKVHADGDSPGNLIDERRPGEDEEIKEYRKKIFEPVTSSVMSKVLTELSKIRRSSDWSIRHSSNPPAIIRKGETLEDYCEKSYPVFDSITNWVFEELLKIYCIDSNALCCVLPINFEKDVTDFYKPVAEMVESGNVLEFLDTEYVLFKSTETASYTDSNGDIQFDAAIYYYIDKDQVIRFQQNGKSDKLTYTEYVNISKVLPAFKIPGVFYKKIGKNKVNKSRLDPLVPYLNEATREYSDLQAEVVQHIHSTMWYYSNTNCKKCQGTGKVISKLPGNSPTQPQTCSECEGVGFVQTSPYKQNFRVTPPSNTNAHQIPTPPAGYIQKQTDIVKLQDERVDSHLYKALGSISLEYLMQVPLSQSGVAKAYDRDGANNFVYGVAEDLVRVMDRVYKLINLWRFNEIITNENDLTALVPVITVPEKYDLFNSQIILTLIRDAKAAGVSILVLNEMMREYTTKYFNANPDVAKMLSAMLELDPLVGYTIDEKISMVSTGLVKKEDGIVSSYIQMFIQKAVSEDESFLDKSSTEKRVILEKMATDKLKEMSTVAELMKVAPPATPPPTTPPTA